MHIIPPGEEADLDSMLQEEYELESLQDLTDTLDEHKHIIEFIPTAIALVERASNEYLELVFHIFTDGRDEYRERYTIALSLYLKLRAEGQTNTRLYYQLYEDRGNNEMVEEDCLISYGDYPQ